jgi:hypothetical protein
MGPPPSDEQKADMQARKARWRAVHAKLSRKRAFFAGCGGGDPAPSIAELAKHYKWDAAAQLRMCAEDQGARMKLYALIGYVKRFEQEADRREAIELLVPSLSLFDANFEAHLTDEVIKALAETLESAKQRDELTASLKKDKELLEHLWNGPTQE